MSNYLNLVGACVQKLVQLFAGPARPEVVKENASRHFEKGVPSLRSNSECGKPPGSVEDEVSLKTPIVPIPTT
jgi:hypothetical protein